MSVFLFFALPLMCGHLALNLRKLHFTILDHCDCCEFVGVGLPLIVWGFCEEECFGNVDVAQDACVWHAGQAVDIGGTGYFTLGVCKHGRSPTLICDNLALFDSYSKPELKDKMSTVTWLHIMGNVLCDKIQAKTAHSRLLCDKKLIALM